MNAFSKHFSPKKNGKNCSGDVKFVPKCSEKFEKGTRPLPETFGNFRERYNGEKCKKSPNGTPWGVMDKSVPGSVKRYVEKGFKVFV